MKNLDNKIQYQISEAEKMFENIDCKVVNDKLPCVFIVQELDFVGWRFCFVGTKIGDKTWFDNEKEKAEIAWIANPEVE